MIQAELLEKLKVNFISFENWVLAGSPDPPPANIPREYTGVFRQCPYGYQVFRHALLRLIKHLGGEDAIIKDLDSLVDDVGRRYPAQFSSIVEALMTEDGAARFSTQWQNAFEVSKDFREGPVGLTPPWLHLYQSKYEVDEVLSFLAMLTTLRKKRVADTTLNRFRDKSGFLKKGVLVDAISARLQDLPALRAAVHEGYNPRLRNTVGHNRYRIVGDTITSLDGDITVTKEEFVRACFQLQELQNFVILKMAEISLVAHEIPQRTGHCGIASVGFAMEQRDGVEEPLLTLFQLWCFYAAGREGDWLGSVRLKIEDDRLRTIITPTVSFLGERVEGLRQWLDAVSTAGIVLVGVIAVTPYVGADNESLELGWGEYQETGDEWERMVPATQE